jgi:hypothetical protein
VCEAAQGRPGIKFGVQPRLGLAYQPRGRFKLPSFPQARRFWYQWFMALDQGAEAVRADPKGFARIQYRKGVTALSVAIQPLFHDPDVCASRN